MVTFGDEVSQQQISYGKLEKEVKAAYASLDDVCLQTKLYLCLDSVSC